MSEARRLVWDALYGSVAYEAAANETPNTPGLMLFNQQRLIDCVEALARRVATDNAFRENYLDADLSVSR